MTGRPAPPGTAARCARSATSSSSANAASSSRDYVAAAFVQIIGPTAVRFFDETSWRAFLDDAELARRTGVFPSAFDRSAGASRRSRCAGESRMGWRPRSALRLSLTARSAWACRARSSAAPPISRRCSRFRCPVLRHWEASCPVMCSQPTWRVASGSRDTSEQRTSSRCSGWRLRPPRSPASAGRSSMTGAPTPNRWPRIRSPARHRRRLPARGHRIPAPSTALGVDGRRRRRHADLPFDRGRGRPRGSTASASRHPTPAPCAAKPARRSASTSARRRCTLPNRGGSKGEPAARAVDVDAPRGRDLHARPRGRRRGREPHRVR